MTTGLDGARARLDTLQPGAARLDLSGLRLETEDLEDLFGAVIEAVTVQGVTELDLSGNRLVFLPQPFGRLQGLTSLRLARNALVRLPESFGQLTTLSDLDLSGNQLTFLPDSVRELRAVRNLDVSDNRLTFLTEHLGTLSELKVLDMSSNEISELSNAVGGFIHLERLDLHSNRLTWLPSVFCLLVELTYLDLSDNWFTVRPDEAEQVPATAEIRLGGNPFATPPPVFVSPDVKPPWAQETPTETVSIVVHAAYSQFYVFDEQADGTDSFEVQAFSGDGLMAPSERAIRMVSARAWGDIRIIVALADHFTRPQGVASATDLSLPSGVLAITGYEAPIQWRHDFGRPTRVRILLEVSGRDAMHDGDGGPPEVVRMTVVATDRPRPRWRSVVTDRVGEAMRQVRETDGPWRTADEP